MRLTIDSLIALLLVGVLGLVLADYRSAMRKLEAERQVHLALSRLAQQARCHGAIEAPGGRGPVFAATISPAWFKSQLPVNALAPGYAWLDVAPAGDGADDPPDPVLRSRSQAGFWYNPNRGVVRARVPGQRGPAEALDLYNQLNNSGLKALPESAAAERRPVPWAARCARGVEQEKVEP
jgi:hypothetical protein